LESGKAGDYKAGNQIRNIVFLVQEKRQSFSKLQLLGRRFNSHQVLFPVKPKRRQAQDGQKYFLSAVSLRLARFSCFK
jgi:hypothetical protein